MSDDKTTEINDPIEQKIWDEVVNMIVKLAQMAQKLQFHKYKLNYLLEIGDKNSHLTTIDNLKNRIAVLTEEFNKYYKAQLQTINELYDKNSNKPRVIIMLDAAKDKMQTLLTYNELKRPTFAELELKSQIKPIQTEQEKPNDITPIQNQ